MKQRAGIGALTAVVVGLGHLRHRLFDDVAHRVDHDVNLAVIRLRRIKHCLGHSSIAHVTDNGGDLCAFRAHQANGFFILVAGFSTVKVQYQVSALLGHGNGVGASLVVARSGHDDGLAFEWFAGCSACASSALRLRSTRCKHTGQCSQSTQGLAAACHRWIVGVVDRVVEFRGVHLVGPF